ncbi:MAG: aminoglycoside phosphotransferase [Actinobacteria bacterium]|nr:aminoglycoside phosphotransferase [Actinomycetota bacterium]
MADARLTQDVWLEQAPELVAECAEEWELDLGQPYEPGAAGYAIRADRDDGTPAVLKLIYPHRESEHEADALALLGGNGAVRLLARDDARSAMLLERCEPGTALAESGGEAALDVLVELLPKHWVKAGDPFHTLEDEASWWIDYLPEQWEQSGRAIERRLVDAAVDALRSLSTSQGEQVLLNQDLHGDNVLAAGREPWLVIDPKPLVGEREFAVASIVRSSELGHGKRAALYRLDRLTSELGLDRERARGWTIGQAMAWAFEDSYSAEHLDLVRWLLEDAE